MANITVIEEPVTRVGELSRIPIAFTVEHVWDMSAVGEKMGGWSFEERSVLVPFIKDYDAIPNQGPANWVNQFDLSNWVFLGAWRNGERVGGAVIALNTVGVDMLEGRCDLAVLWDIRVVPALRGNGFGAALFRAAETSAQSRGCRELKVETQNINVPACRFYARQGCTLRGVVVRAYPEFPDEVQLLWHKNLGG